MPFHIESTKYRKTRHGGDPVAVVISIGRTRNAVSRLSTIQLPAEYGYETCYFHGRESNVVERYNTESEAIIGHHKWMKKYGFNSLSYTA